MLIQCPKCQAKLELPADVEGKKVRCPACQEIFHATSEIVTNAIQAGEPENKPPSNVGNAAQNRKGFDDDDDLDRRLDSMREDAKDVEAEAKSCTRVAGWVNIGAAVFFAFDILVTLVLLQLTGPDQVGQLRGREAELAATIQAFMPVCIVLLYAPMIIFVLLGGRALLSLGSRGLIITGIVFNGIIVLLLGCGTLFSVFTSMTPDGRANMPPGWVYGTTLGLGVISGILNLVAFILAIKALTRDPVAQYFRLKSGTEYRGR